MGWPPESGCGYPPDSSSGLSKKSPLQARARAPALVGVSARRAGENDEVVQASTPPPS
jgi:hypothetical protein